MDGIPNPFRVPGRGYPQAGAPGAADTSITGKDAQAKGIETRQQDASKVGIPWTLTTYTTVGGDFLHLLAPQGTNRQYRIHGYVLELLGAAPSSDITFTFGDDSALNPLWREVFPATSLPGSRLVMTFDRPLIGGMGRGLALAANDGGNGSSVLVNAYGEIY